MTILKLRQANNPESTTKLAYIRELAVILQKRRNQQNTLKKLTNINIMNYL